MKFYKLVEISETEYLNKTNDINVYMCIQSTIPLDNAVYVAFDEDEAEKLEIDTETLNELNCEEDS